MYPIMNLQNWGKDIHAFVSSLEKVIFGMLPDFGISARTADWLTGVWAGNEKIAFTGIEVRKCVTMHGFAVNVSDGRKYFSLFVPCGLRHVVTTSMDSCYESHEKISIEEVKHSVLKYFSCAFSTSISNFVSKSAFKKDYLVV